MQFTGKQRKWCGREIFFLIDWLGALPTHALMEGTEGLVPMNLFKACATIYNSSPNHSKNNILYLLAD
ncbi:hypothetical protein ACHAW6_009382 [Cyclotella cf. meneghiniana]